MTFPRGIPEEFNELPEPGRAKAFDFFQELLTEGREEREAIEQAIARARHWIAERARPAQ